MSATKVMKAGKEKIGRTNTPLQNGKTDISLSSVKNQPTAEQIRLAQLTSDRSSDTDPDLSRKVTQISELTGRSNDEALTALYDCDYDVQRAVEKLLECQEIDEWQEISKKKKMSATNKLTTSSSDAPEDSKTVDQEMELNHSDATPRGGGSGFGQRAGPKFQRGGRGRGFGSSGADRTDRNSSASREHEQGFESSRGRPRRGNFAGDSRGFGRGRRGGRGGVHSNKFETRIDTWISESSTQNGDKDTNVEDWNADVSEDWTADEWNGSLKESCVFTPSASSFRSSTSAANDGHLEQQTPTVVQTQTFTPGLSSSGDAFAAVASTFSSMPLTRAVVDSGPDYSHSQHHGIKDAVQTSSKLSLNCYNSAPLDGTVDDVSHFNKEATECIKNAMGIGRPGFGQNGANVNEAGGQSMVISCHGLPTVNLHQPHPPRAKQPQPRVAPPSKIPTTPVEMPDTMISGRLDVQFGNWDTAPIATTNYLHFMPDMVTSPDLSQSSSASVTNVVNRDRNAGITIESSVSSQEKNRPVKTSAYTSVKASSGGPGPTVDSTPSKVVSASPGSTGLTTSAASAPSHLGFVPLPYSSSSPAAAPSSDGTAPSGHKLPNAAANGHSLYNNNSLNGPSPPYGFQQGAIPANYSASQNNTRYTYGDAPQRYGGGGGGTAPMAPPGYGGPVSNQQFGNGAPSQGQQPKTSYAATDKPTMASYAPSGGDQRGGLDFPANPAYIQSAGAGYQSAVIDESGRSSGFRGGSSPSSAGGFKGLGQTAGGFPSGVHLTGFQGAGLSGPGGTGGFQGMSADVAGYETDQNVKQTNVYRQRDAQAGGNSDSQRVGTTSSSAGAMTQHNVQSTGSTFDSQTTTTPGGGQNQGTGGLQSTGPPTYGNASQAPPSGQQLTRPAYVDQQNNVNRPPSVGTQSFVGGGRNPTPPEQKTTPTGNLVSNSMTPAHGKLTDGLSKLNVKDGHADVATDRSTPSSVAMAMTPGATSNVGAASTYKAVPPPVVFGSKAAAAAAPSQTGKTLPNLPPGMPASNAMMNPNYLIGQPPGFQLAAFGYPQNPQPLTYTYEELQNLQLLQQRFSLPGQYYDMPLQTSAALTGREASNSIAVQSYTGNDVKLSAMDVLSPVNAQPGQQPQAVTGNQQQAYINAGLHPAYSYYYPGTPGLVPMPSYYTQMVPVGGLAIPSVTNPAMAGTTSTTQYQKPTVFGSHAYPQMGGQAQDFVKNFVGSQVQNRGGVGVGGGAGIGAPSNDMMAAPGNFGKTQMQLYERGAYNHGGTPPPAFGMAMPSAGGGGAGQAGSMGAPAVYGPPYMPLLQHQSHSQPMHHAYPQQDSGVAGPPGRTAPPASAQPKVGGGGGNKPYSNTYWGSN